MSELPPNDQPSEDQPSEDVVVRPRSSGGVFAVMVVVFLLFTLIGFGLMNSGDILGGNPRSGPNRVVGVDPVTNRKVKSTDTGISRVRAGGRFRAAKWIMDMIDKVPIGGGKKKKKR